MIAFKVQGTMSDDAEKEIHCNIKEVIARLSLAVETSDKELKSLRFSELKVSHAPQVLRPLSWGSQREKFHFNSLLFIVPKLLIRDLEKWTHRNLGM